VAVVAVAPSRTRPNRTRLGRKLDPGLTWYGDVRQKLQAAIDAHSSCTGTFSGSPAPVAIFDWDNTVVKNDIGYGTNYWMLRNDKVLQPANQDWKTTDRYMTDAAAAALKTACGTDVPAGEPLKTSTNTAMFIAPKKQVADPYPCSTTAFTKSDGTSAPLRRDDGSVVPDQKDSVS
jgi:hypothetical protein